MRKGRNISSKEQFLSQFINTYILHAVSSDGGKLYIQVCNFLNLFHHLYSVFEKNVIEGTIHYIKDRAERFDDYFSWKKQM